MKLPSTGNRSVLLAFLVVLLIFGALVIRKYMISSPSPEVNAPVVEEPRQLREIILYFGNEEGLFLEPEAREIEDCLEEIECVRATVQALLDGPVGNRTPVLPPQVTLIGVSSKEGTTFIDFSREIVAGHPGGSMSELLTVYALANTVAANFPHLRQVQILVAGEVSETLKGHVDLRRPIKADFTFGRPPSRNKERAADTDDAMEDVN